MIDRLVADIDTALKNGAFMSALALALTLPDACGKAAYPKLGDTKRYITWFNRYVKHTGYTDSDMPYLSGEIVFNLRCSFLHQNTPNIDKNKIKTERCRVDEFALVTVDDLSYGISSKVIGRGEEAYRELHIGIKHLCLIIMDAAKTYYQSNREKFDFIQYRIIDNEN